MALTGTGSRIVPAKGKRPSFNMDELAPIVLKEPKPRRTLTVDSETTLVGGDFHFGAETHSPECEEIFLAVARDVRPGTIVLNGDLPDCLAVSKYPKDYRTSGPLATERKQYAEFLYRLREVCPSSKLVETNANHSGNGIESRWSRYLSDRIPELMEDPELAERWSYQSIFYPSWANIDLVDYYAITKGFIALHGDIVRSQAAYSARAMLEKWRISLIHGHTHRMGHYSYRVPGIAGKREHHMRAWEGGCLCRLTAPYMSTTNWVNGFSVVRHTEDGLFSVEQVVIENDEAVCATTGLRYTASK